jgi:hypothetical protein
MKTKATKATVATKRKKVLSHLRAERRAWGLTQDEMACLVGAGGRHRVSDLELEVFQPKGGEILAYSLIFGCRPAKLFPKLCEETEEGVMRGAARLEKRMRADKTPAAPRKRQLLDLIGARATGKASLTAV